MRKKTRGVLTAALTALFAALFAFALGIFAPRFIGGYAEESTDGDATYAATIGADGYATLQEAINAATDGQTVTLNAAVTEDITVAAGKVVTLDLNGNTLTNAGGHTITNNGTLTVIDGSVDHTGTVDNVTHQRAAVYNEVGATAYLYAGTYTRSAETGVDADTSGGNSYYVMFNHGTMVMGEAGQTTYNITVEADGKYSSLFENGWYNGNQNTTAAPSTLTINGGAYSGGLNTVKNDDYGVMTINGGSFSNTAQAVVLNWNKLEITGGTFTANKIDAVVLTGKLDDTMDNGETVIKGGDFTAKGKYDADDGTSVNTVLFATMGGSSQVPSVEINDGTFVGVFSLDDAGKTAYTLNGGIFDHKIDDKYVPEGTTVYQGVSSKDVFFPLVTLEEGQSLFAKADGTYEVKSSEYAVAKINDASYESLQAALDAVQKTSLTVNLLKDTEEDITYTVTKNVAIAFNGHTVTGDLAFTALTKTIYIGYSGQSLANVETGENVGKIIGTLAINGTGTGRLTCYQGADAEISQLTVNSYGVVYLYNGTYENITVNKNAKGSGTSQLKILGGVVTGQITVDESTECTLQGGVFQNDTPVIDNGGTVSVKISDNNKYAAPRFINAGNVEKYLAQGYVFADTVDRNGYYYVIEDRLFEVDGEYYNGFSAAISSAHAGGTVKLLKDYTMSYIQSFNSKSVTIDLNGHKIYSTYSPSSATYSYFAFQIGYSLSNKFTVTFTDSSEAKSGAIIYTGTADVQGMGAFNVTYGSKLVIENITVDFTGNAKGIGISAGDGSSANLEKNYYGEVELKNATVKAAYYGVALWGCNDAATPSTLTAVNSVIEGGMYAVVGNGIFHNTEITLTDCEVAATDTPSTGIYHPQVGKLTVSGGSVSGTTGIEIRSGSLTVNGGAKITGTGETFATEANGNGTSVSGAAVAISQHATNKDISVSLGDGVYTGVYAVYEADLMDETVSNIAVEITDGTYNGSVSSENVTGYISGGTFSEQVENTALKDGYVLYSADNGYVALEGEEEVTYVATLANKGYATLTEAIAAATAGQTVRLIADVTEDVTVEADKAITLDLNGYTLTNDKDHTITNYGTLTVVDSSADGSGVVDNVTHAKGAIVNYGEAYLNGGNYTRSNENGQSSTDNGGNSWYVLKNYGYMVIGEDEDSNITVRADGKYSSLIANGYQNESQYNSNHGKVTATSEATLVINGGTFSGGINTIKNDDCGSAEINGGEFTNTSQFVVQNWNVLAVNGGTFTPSNSATAAIWTGYSTTKYGDEYVNQGKADITDGVFNGGVVAGYAAVTYSISGGTYTVLPASKYLAEGMLYYVDDDGNYVADNSENAVAKIGGVGYATLPDAISGAADGQTVKLLTNVTVDESIYVTADVTLDLNGSDITLTSGSYYGIAVLGASLTVVGNGNISGYYDPFYTADSDGNYSTLVLGAADGSSLITVSALGSPTDCVVYLTGNTSFTLNKGVTVAQHNPAFAVGVMDNSVAHIYGTVTGDGSNEDGSLESGGVATNGLLGQNGTINIYDGAEIRTNGVAVYLPIGSLTVGGGYIEGSTGIEVRAGKAVINGGTVKATGDPFEDNPNGSGTTTNGAAIAIVQHTTKLDISVTVTGGTFEGVRAVYEGNVQGNDESDLEKISLSLENGTFNGEIVTDDLSGYIKGGTYSDLADYTYFAEGYSAKLSDGVYVTENVAWAAAIDNVGYQTMQDAITAATDGQTVKLLSDITESVTIAEGQNIVLDLGGHTLSGEKTTAITNNGALTITGNGNVSATFPVDNSGNLTIENGTYGNGTFSAFDVNGSVTVNGGSFIGCNIIVNGNAESLVITDGEFTAVNTSDNADKVKISGGSFVTMPDEACLAKDVLFYVDDNGNYVADKSDSAVAKIGGVGYTTLQAAISAAKEGDTVTLLAEIQTDGTLIIEQPITLDLGGHKITADTNTGISVRADNVTVKNGTLTVTTDALLIINGIQVSSAYKGAVIDSIDITVTSPGASNGYGLDVYGISVEYNAAAIIKNSTVTVNGSEAANRTGFGTGIQVSGGSNVTVTDVELKGSLVSSGILVESGELTASGLTVEAEFADDGWSAAITVLGYIDSASLSGVKYTYEGAKANVGDVTITAGSTSPATFGINNQGGDVILNGTISGCSDECVYSSGWAYDNTNNKELSGVGSVTVEADANLVIGEDAYQAINLNGGKLTVNGGVIEGIYAYAYNGDLEVALNGGTVNGGVCVEYDPETNDYTIKNIGITAGTYSGSVEVGEVGVYEQTGFISGGTFNEMPAEEYLAADCLFNANADGTYTVADADGSAAKIGNIGYATLQAAIDAAAEGETVVLIGNVSENITVAAGKVITLDLKGYTLTNNGGHTITNNGTLTVVDSSADGSGVVDNVTHAKGALYNNGTAYLNGGTFTRSKENGTKSGNGGNSWYTIRNEGAMVIDGATVTTRLQNESGAAVGGYSSLIGNNISCKTPGATLEIKSGTFSGGINTVKNDEAGVLSISGGEFKNTTQAVVLNWSEATITGGVFEAGENLSAVTTGKWNAATPSQNVITNITGGTFKGAINVTYGEGGTYFEPELKMNNISAGEGTLPQFTIAPDHSYLAEGFTLTQGEDGSYTLVDVTPYSDELVEYLNTLKAQYGDFYNETSAEKLAAVLEEGVNAINAVEIFSENELENLVGSYKAKMDAVIVEQLSADMAALSEKIDALTKLESDDHEAVLAAISGLSDQLKALQDVIGNFGETETTVSEKLAEISAALETLKTDLTDYIDVKVKELADDVAELNALTAANHKEVTEKLVAMGEELTALKDALATLTASEGERYTELSGKIDAIQTKLGDLDELAQAVAALDGKVAGLDTLLQQIDGKVDTVDGLLDALTAAVNAKFTEITDKLAAMESVSEADNEALKAEIQELATSLAALKTATDTLTAGEAEHYEKLTAQITALESKLASLETLSSAIDELGGKIDALDGKLGELTDIIEQLKQQLAEQEDKSGGETTAVISVSAVSGAIVIGLAVLVVVMLIKRKKAG